MIPIRLHFASILCLFLVGILSVPLIGQQPPASPPILLGTAWYPEQWPESRWETDLALMEHAGVRMVRIGEFAWSRMEPGEGSYDLDWMEKTIA
ncbi:MAG TPA: beta-galactosidase, partial [Terriglobales bacterium]